MLEDIIELEKLSPRQRANEHKAGAFIKRRLSKCNTEYIIQKFRSYLPFYSQYVLMVDGKRIDCMPTALRSGIISDKNLISSMAVSGRYYEEPNINFNPYSDVISLATFYRAPSLAIGRKDVQKIIDAQQIKGSVKVEKRAHTCENILVGNVKNPRNIIIVHYDSVLGGADDDASGVAMLLELIRRGAGKRNMFVFSGCEELSFDKPIYWGRGYRELERENEPLMLAAKRIIAVDMIGSGMPGVVRDQKLRLAAFPISNPNLFKKSTVIGTLGHEWFSQYHTINDKPSNVKLKFLNKGLDIVSDIIRE